MVIKALKPEYSSNPVYQTLLHKEYEIGHSLDHPNICRTYYWGKFPISGNGILMEWIDGTTLRKLLDSGRKLTPSAAREIICQICSALSYMHSKQIIHRDLKPENILITHNGSHVKIIDFGFSDSDSSTVLKKPAGTLTYASPELREGREADYRTDIYSLGKIIAEISPQYSSVVRRSLRENPAERYQSADQVKKAVMTRGTRIAGITAAAAAAIAASMLLIFIPARSTSSATEKIMDSVRKEIINQASSQYPYDREFLLRLDEALEEKDSTLFMKKMLPYIHNDYQKNLIEKIASTL